MTELEPITSESPTAEPVPNTQPLSDIQQWANDARDLHAIAQSIAKTSFVPPAFRDKPHEITACWLAGAELGINRMASLQALEPIMGKPTLNALAMRALVQGAGHDIEVIEESSTKAVVKGIRRGPNGEARSEHVVTWTIEQAQQLNLSGKENWKKQPKTMLVARATAEVCRRTASDVLLGMAYSVEEMRDEAALAAVETSSEVAEVPTDTVKRQRKPLPATN